MPLGDALCLKGNMVLGKRYLLHAWLEKPGDFSCFIHLLLSLFGCRVFAKLHPLMSETRIGYALRSYSQFVQ
jgi:hypothetical protein